MTHKKNNSGIWITAGLIAFVAIAYLISPQGKRVFAGGDNNQINTSTTPSYNQQGGGGCPMMRNNPQGGGCGGGRTITTTATTTNTAVDPSTAYETINVGHTSSSLLPETVTLAAGKSYKLVITPSADGAGCMNTMTFPGLDSNVYPVKNGVPVTIVINNAKAGTYQVVCGAMGMHQGTIVIQ